ncbi:B3 DNA binding domain-containing protein [Tanacetum coccineum]
MGPNTVFHGVWGRLRRSPTPTKGREAASGSTKGRKGPSALQGLAEMRRSGQNNALQIVTTSDWPVSKILTLSDVDITHPFLTLPRQPVETYILCHLTQLERDQLANKEQVAIDAQDDDTGEHYIMKIKWLGSYYNLIGKWGKIVRSKGLEAGKEIKIAFYHGCLHFSVPHQQPQPQQQHIPPPQPLQVVPPPAPVVNHVNHNYWPIKKVLTLSDVDTNHPFLPLTRKQVEDHILAHWTPQQRELLRNEEEVNLNARDVDTDEIYVMKLRWRGNYYNLIGKWGKIVRRKGLGAGKEIKIRWANGSLNFSVPYEPVVVQTSMPVMMSHHHDEWPIRKVLTLSDVDINHPFLTLPGKSVEDHILLYWASQAREHLRNEHQINVNARDDDTGDVFLMKLKWRGSYYNLIGKWGQIIRGKTLEVGQEIRVRWDNGYLVFSVA